LDRRLGGPQNRSGLGAEEKNYHPMPGLEPPIIQLLAQRYTIELGEMRNVYKILVGKPEWKRPRGRHRRRWEENIIKDVTENKSGKVWIGFIWLTTGSSGGFL
jgi:hypothetical protein